jgi:hypothetical protein
MKIENKAKNIENSIKNEEYFPNLKNRKEN